MYSPLSGKHEIFIRNQNVPKIPHTPGLVRHFGLVGYCAPSTLDTTINKSAKLTTDTLSTKLFTPDLTKGYPLTTAKDPAKILRDYLNKQDIRLVYEIERPSIVVPQRKNAGFHLSHR
jgi:hypothetical protein